LASEAIGRVCRRKNAVGAVELAAQRLAVKMRTAYHVWRAWSPLMDAVQIADRVHADREIVLA
jgi:hypothetical protein